MADFPDTRGIVSPHRGSIMSHPLPLILSVATTLPKDADVATLIGRVWRPDLDGPSVVRLDGETVVDITAAFPTVSQLCEEPDPARAARAAKGERLGELAGLLVNTPTDRQDPGKPWLLAPIDLQAVKASGVTFVTSLIERVIEEQARGAPERAAAVRAEIAGAIGSDLRALKPGSPAAATLKALLIEKGLWSQYLEVGIGPDAEIFTKAQPMASVGHGAEIGIHPGSSWNNPEPEVVLAVSSAGRIVGATLGNDVNLRDFEGRSALLLGKAKDNNASSAIGPFLRLFDGGFTLDHVRKADIGLRVEGPDQFTLDGRSSISEISRDPEDLVHQLIGACHQYPDGVVLYLGTMFAPTRDRRGPGQGFTHEIGDIVTIATPALGALTNRVTTSDRAPAWRFGASQLMRNLAKRRLL
jgi:fumarylacetoacetate (FAA) hydrolase family protein